MHQRTALPNWVEPKDFWSRGDRPAGLDSSVNRGLQELAAAESGGGLARLWAARRGPDVIGCEFKM
jgi:hypothetical protein